MEGSRLDERSADLLAREAGLERRLTADQLTMIALGGAIGTGLFLGSALAIRMAGPGIILSYIFGALLAWLLTRALAEMAVAHPTAGSFGAYAELYVSPWAGFATRWSYWFAQAVVIGGDAVALSIYCGWWFPNVDSWVWISAAGVTLFALNARNVYQFGQVEYLLSMIKIVAIGGFVAFGVLLLSGIIPGTPAIGLTNLTEHGGFLRTEVVAVTAGEAEDPAEAIPRALRNVIVRLALFYVAAVFVLVALVPWNSEPASADITGSPFVQVFERVGVPAAPHLINLVVVIAALSSMNCNLYTATRTLFSLSRGGYAPAFLGRVSKSGIPLPALLATGSGLLVAVILATVLPQGAYFYLFGVALFAALFVWLVCFISHLRFRRAWAQRTDATPPLRLRGGSSLSLFGALAIVAIMLTTWWVPAMRVTLLVGLPWLAGVSLIYFVVFRKKTP
jgi:L-asparagine transporter-like permease